MSVHPWPGVRVLGMPYLHDREFQVMQDMTVQRKRKFNLVTRLHYVLQGGKSWGAGLHAQGHADLGHGGGSSSTHANLIMRFPGFGMLAHDEKKRKNYQIFLSTPDT